MAWIESHQELRDHPKVVRLARLLDVSRPQAVGLLHFLWWWALDHAEDGDLSNYDAVDIAAACDWQGDPEALLEALIDCGPGSRSGFIERTEQGMIIHDWWDHAGRLVEARRNHAAQKRKHNELYNDKTLTAAIRKRDGDFCRYCGAQVNWQDRRGSLGATYDYVDPSGPTSLENIVVACRACNAGKNQRTPEQAGYRLLPADHWRASARNPQVSNQDLDQQAGYRLLPADHRQKPARNLQVSNQDLDQQYSTVQYIEDLVGRDTAATGGEPSRPRKRPATRAPASFEVTDALRAWAAEKKLDLVDLDAETERFLDHHRAKDSRFSDWNAAWRTWMRRAQQYAAERQASSSVGANGHRPGYRLDANGNRVMDL